MQPQLKPLNGVSYTGLTKIGGSGSPTTLNTTEGVYALDGTPSLNFKQVPSAPYGSNEIEVSYSISGAVITIFTDLSDDYAPPDPASPDNIDGTLSQALQLFVFHQVQHNYLTSWGHRLKTHQVGHSHNNLQKPKSPSFY